MKWEVPHSAPASRWVPRNGVNRMHNKQHPPGPYPRLLSHFPELTYQMAITEQQP